MEKIDSIEREFGMLILYLTSLFVSFELTINVLTSLVGLLSFALCVLCSTIICISKNFNENREMQKMSRNFWTTTSLLFVILIKIIYKGEPTDATSFLGLAILMPALMSIIQWIIWLFDKVMNAIVKK